MKGFALHTWTLDTTPLTEVLRVAKATGWDAVELRRLDFKRMAEAGLSAGKVLDLVRGSGLQVSCVGVAVGWMFAEGTEREPLLRAFDESCGWAEALNCTTVMSPVDPGKGDVQRAAASIREVGDIARRHGVRLALEANSQCEQYNTLERVCEALSLAAHPGCGFLLDTYHLQRSGGSVQALKEIVYFQFSDVPRQGLVPGKSLDRLPAGQGCVPFREIFAHLRRIGYDGYLSYEAPNPAAWSRDPQDVAREALQAARALLP